MRPIGEIKLFQTTRSDWWAGTNLEECITAAVEELGMDRSEAVDDSAHELTDLEADTLLFVEGDDPVPPNFTFRMALQHCVDRGDRFPQHFASTEW